LQYLLHRRRFDSELSNDMEFHREMAGREGKSNFGNALHLREEAREAWGWMWLERAAQDLRYATRMLRKSPGFTLAAVLMLAIGIGVNVAAFAFFDLMVLRPLNVRDPATLLRFHRRAEPLYAYALPYPEMAFLRDHTRTLSAVLAVNTTRIAVEGEQKQLPVQFVSANLFHELGATPLLGRFLDPSRDDASNAAPVIVLGYGFWQRHFGGDPQVVGRTLRLNGKPAVIVGVAPAAFSGLSMNQSLVWAPLEQQPYYAAGSHLLTDFAVESPGVEMWGRLLPGIAPAAAEQELASLVAELRKQQPTYIWEKERMPSEPGGYATSLRIGTRSGTGSEGRDQMVPIYALVGAMVLLILAVACANLGSLLLARGVAREREMAIRVSVGAGNGRLIRQLFTESLLLAIAGSVAGLAFGCVVLRELMVITGAPAWLDPAPDWRIAAFSVGAGFVSAILFGLTPALQVVRQRHRAAHFRQLLVGTQVAASCVLLIVAGLLGRALTHATSSDPGFEYRHVVSIDPGLSRNGYTPGKAQAYLDSLETRLRALPGVESVSLVLAPPLGHVTISVGFDVDGRPINTLVNHVDPAFFHTMKIALLRGRGFTRGEKRVVVLGEGVARAAWPGQNPLGKVLPFDGGLTVIGIAGQARMVKPQDSDSSEIYIPADTGDAPSLSILMRTAGPPEDLARSAAAATRAQDPNTFAEISLLKNAFQENLQGAEYSAVAVTLFGAIAQLLACLGILGVVSYAVSQRTREIGVRMALGAKPSHVLSVVLRQFALPVAAGLLIGVAGAAALSGFLRGLLYGISNFDAASYLGAIGIFAATVALAAVLPARRALKIDPIRALRYE
jgi:predicted permease